MAFLANPIASSGLPAKFKVSARNAYAHSEFGSERHCSLQFRYGEIVLFLPERIPAQHGVGIR